MKEQVLQFLIELGLEKQANIKGALGTLGKKYRRKAIDIEALKGSSKHMFNTLNRPRRTMADVERKMLLRRNRPGPL